MLEKGYKVFDCQIVKPLTENKLYQSYLVSCADLQVAKLFVVPSDPQLDQRQQQTLIDYADWLTGHDLPSVGSPRKAAYADGQFFYLYPYVEEPSLLQDLEGAFTTQQGLDLVKEIATALKAAHHVGFWHGSLSPDHLYQKTDGLFLADFSLNQLVRLDFRSGVDPHYASPEQVRGEEASYATDIYSLGCIFYHLLTGKTPFSGDEPFAIAKQHLQDEFPFLPEDLQILQPMMTAMTASVAGERISLDDLLDQIDDIQASLDLHPIPPVTAQTKPKTDESPFSDQASRLDDALSHSEIAARVEARLKEHAVDLQTTEDFEQKLDDDIFNTDTELDRTRQVKRPKAGGVLLILFLGIVIGSGLHFLLNEQLINVASEDVVATVAVAALPMVDLDHGLQLWREADFNGAEAEFKQIIAENQQDPRAYNNLAAFYAAQGNYEHARDYLQQALEIDEKYATIYQNLGSVYAEMARGSYGRALQLDQTKKNVYLPVFSNQGVVELHTHADVISSAQLPETEIASENFSLPEVEEGVSAVDEGLIVAIADAPVVMSQKDEPAAVITEVNVAKPYQDEQPPAEAEPSEEEGSDSNEVASPVLQPESAEEFLQRWAQAWSNQDVDAYLGFYGDQFVPSGRLSRADWEAQRQSRLLAPKKIIVRLSGVTVFPEENGFVTVEVVQDYESNLLADRFKKAFDLLYDGRRWQIVRERSLGRVR